MLTLNEIVVGIVAWPDPNTFSADNGCSMPFSIHRSLHPMVCIERNETHGVWLGLSSRDKTAGGRLKMEIPKGWRIGSKSWIEKTNYVGDLTCSIIVPHEVMVQATAKTEFACQQRHRITTQGAEELLRLVKRAEGYHLSNNPAASVRIAPKPAIVVKRLPKQAKSRLRLSNAEYEDLLARFASGEHPADLAKAFDFPEGRIKQFLAYRKRVGKLPTSVKESDAIDLTKVSVETLRKLLAKKERMADQEATRRQIEDYAKGLGVRVTALEFEQSTRGH